jgi:hypothetical protein
VFVILMFLTKFQDELTWSYLFEFEVVVDLRHLFEGTRSKGVAFFFVEDGATVPGDEKLSLGACDVPHHELDVVYGEEALFRVHIVPKDGT